ncbi:MAG TPA: Crp/Fnr family transcriptional regulator [Gammaproteobacteria bacterium]|nr:Crp/Fnr family transcriptional regulator [Gammaproteobacteria bacterium]
MSGPFDSPAGRIRLLQNMPVFGGIRADTLEFLLSGVARVRLARGEYFYREGDMADSLFVLESGRVFLLKHWAGNDYKLKELVRGNCFGEVAVIDLQPRNTSSLAAEDSCALELTEADLYRLYQHDVEQFTLLNMNMAREVCRRLREADERLFEADVQARRVSISPANLRFSSG